MKIVLKIFESQVNVMKCPSVGRRDLLIACTITRHRKACILIFNKIVPSYFFLHSDKGKSFKVIGGCLSSSSTVKVRRKLACKFRGADDTGMYIKLESSLVETGCEQSMIQTSVIRLMHNLI